MNRFISALLALTLLIQVAILYKQHSRSASRLPRPLSIGESVRNARIGSTLDLTGLPTEGQESAKLVLAEFADYECPFCARHAALVAEELHRKYVASGQIKHVFINLPLPAHPNARRLATAVLCAGIQKRYWEMHKAVFQVKPKTDNGIFELAQALGLHVNDFSACLNNTRENQELIERDLRIAKSFELTATPSFAIGSITSSGQMAVKKLVTGAQPLKVFETEIDRLLSEER